MFLRHLLRNQLRRLSCAQAAALFFLTTLLFAAAPAHAYTVTLDAPTVVTPGSRFFVDLRVNDLFSGPLSDDALLAFGFNVRSSEPTALQFQAALVHPAFDDDSALLPGVDVAGSAFPPLRAEGTSVSLLLARLSFEALGSAGMGAPLRLSVISNLDNPNQGLFFAAAGALNLSAETLIEVAAISEPPMVAALLVAFLMLLRARFRT